MHSHATLSPGQQFPGAQRQNINLNGLSERVVAPTAGYRRVVFQCDKQEAWATAVLTVKRSNDGVTWYALTAATVIAVGGGMSAVLDVEGAFMCVEVTTVEGSAAYAHVTYWLQGDVP